MNGLETSTLLGDAMGWLAFFATLGVGMLSRNLRKDHRSATVFGLAMLVHHAFAIVTGLISGLSSDASLFHMWGLERAQSHGFAGFRLISGNEFYNRLLGAAYDLLGASPFLGAELSVLAFAISMIGFLRILSDLHIIRWRATLLALYSLPFSAVFYTTTTLRESYQLLLYVFAIHFAIRYKLHHRPGAALAASASILGMGLFHDGLVVFAALFIGLMLLWPVRRATLPAEKDHSRYAAAAVAIAVVGYVAYAVLSRGLGSSAFAALLSEKVIDFIMTYRAGGIAVTARTNYDIQIDTSSPVALVVSLFLVFVYYLFAPFPWQVRAPADVLGFSEAVLRLSLLIAGFSAWRTSKGSDRSLRAFLLACYFSLAALWSLGTVNYGTAYRHNLTTNWILLLVGGTGFLDWGSALARRLVNRPRVQHS